MTRPVARTAEGFHAGDFLARWRVWLAGADIPEPDPTTVTRLAAEVRSLIEGGFRTREIASALVLWAVRREENPALSPTHLSGLAWSVAMRMRGNQAWPDQVRAAIADRGAVRKGGALGGL